MASLKAWFLLNQVNSWLSFFHHQLEIPMSSWRTSEGFVFKPFKIRWKYIVQISCIEFWSFFFNITRAALASLLLVYTCTNPTCVTTALEVLDCPKVRNYLLSGIWKFRNLSFPILQNSSVSFPTQATVSLIKILFIESPWKLSGGKRFLGQASWVFLSWILLTITQTNKQKSLNV